MQKIILASIAITALGLGACTEQSQQEAAATTDAVASDISDVAGDAGDYIEGTVNAAGDAAEAAGEKIESETDKVRADENTEVLTAPNTTAPVTP